MCRKAVSISYFLKLKIALEDVHREGEGMQSTEVVDCGGCDGKIAGGVNSPTNRMTWHMHTDSVGC